MSKKLDKAYKSSKRIQIDDNTKIVIMSDCHRGAGDQFDNFLKNKRVYEAALNYYYTNNFIYIELGDGDDMWEVKDYNKIVSKYLDIFNLLKKFYYSKRLLMIYGNHDIEKRYPKILKKNLYNYFKNLIVYESLILEYKNHDIFLLHGHQNDFLNSNLWRLSKFLVRYIWRFLELMGIRDLTGVAKNNAVSTNSEKRLKKWSLKNNTILISGHTHRAIFPKRGQSLYFNDGSCIYPNGITCIEIEGGNISLVNWDYTNSSVTRNVLAGQEEIIKFYK